MKQNYIPVNIGVLSFTIFYYTTGNVFAQGKKVFMQNLLRYSHIEKICFIVLVTQTNSTLKTWFNTPEVFTKDCFYKTAIASIYNSV